MYGNGFPGYNNEHSVQESYEWLLNAVGFGQPEQAPSSYPDSFSSAAQSIATDYFGGAEGGYGVPSGYQGWSGPQESYAGSYGYGQSHEGSYDYGQSRGGSYDYGQSREGSYDYGQYYADNTQQASSSAVNESLEDIQSGSEAGDEVSGEFSYGGEVEKLLGDWGRFQTECLSFSGSDTAVENAIQNLSILYLNSLAFRGTVATLSNALRSNQRRIHVRSGESVASSKYSHRNSTIVLNTTNVRKPGKQLGFLALQLTNANYKNLSARQGHSSAEIKQMSLARTALYYQEAGSVLESMGLGSKSGWEGRGFKPQAEPVVRGPLSTIDEQDEELASTSGVNPSYEEPSSPPAYQAQAQRTTKKSGFKRFGGGLMRSLKNLKM
jgi:hypothetical protein